MLKWILIMGTIFSFEAFRLWKFSSYPIWEGKKKTLQINICLGEICEARTNNSKGFESPLLFLLLYGVFWLVIWSWTYTTPAKEYSQVLNAEGSTVIIKFSESGVRHTYFCVQSHIYGHVCVCVCERERERVIQLCPILCDAMDCRLPGSSVHEIL